MKYYIECLRKYAVFTGRARRREYWYFTLLQIPFTFIIVFAIGMVASLSGANSTELSITIIISFFVYTLAMLVPTLAVTCRRLHDIGKSGTFFFVSFIPFIGGIWLLVLLLTEGKYGRNEYGNDPKNVDNELFDFEKDIIAEA